ncbi:serine/threonineeeee kinase 32 [Sporothrix brasiliensis 5110]|uniref:Serine/threonineeeee kinase 32 n=1 Tax=Sporothrix brasiliensis 5110 TaxID=1398154 RepID=A0A0C2IG81_9PEZI|nr:serine/threonineeeee kinase 32 [Sporothrix brasiliensis 5110]KIH88186.1 serine/threonineeeee kinase 32 [Sporothrix brasiliensis 5110]
MGNGQGKVADLTGEVNLNHFRLLRVVGRGAFGKVRIVERKDTNLSFALKYIRKDEVVRSESVRNIIRERRMLEHVNHPFICNLRYSFQDIEYMYLVVDLMSGGDLRFHISRKTFTEDAVRFWIAELGCALRYVHGQGIIHRDVKPDNVLLDADGHVHLTDFNVASDIVPGRTLTSKSGTLAYLAPEVYAGRGYDVRADWWSLGVTFYECIYSKRPFEGNTESSLGATIQNAQPNFPITSPPVSLPCLYAIRDALHPDPDMRLGSTWESFTRHEFFSQIDFIALERKEIEPVFIPSADKTNFDATYDLEELLLEEAPLEARARRQKPRERLKDDATDKEIREDELYRTIERDFRPFDYTLAAYKKLTAEEELRVHGQHVVPFDEDANDQPPQPQAITTDEALPASRASNSNSNTSDPRDYNLDYANLQSPDPHRRAAPPGRPPPLPPYPNPYTNSARNISSRPGRHLGHVPSGSIVVGSSTGGVQVRLDGAGDWSELARQDNTLPTDAAVGRLLGEGGDPGADGKDAGGGGGVFGFLSRKKGRGNSPKPKERGVLGKEGARVVIG